MLYELLVVFIISYILMLGVFSLAVTIMKEWGRTRFSEIAVVSFTTTVVIFVVSVIFSIIK